MLMVLALFAVAPIVCSCLLSLVYTLYLFMAYEESGVHHAQEYENRFWTIFALLFSTALFFAQDSPICIGQHSPSLGFLAVVMSSYAMHLWDRYMHRVALSRQTLLRRSTSLIQSLSDMNVTVEEHLAKINSALLEIDQLLIPSTINNFLNQRYVLKKEKEIISIFSECDAVALNHLVCHVKLGLLIYKIKDHRNFAGQHRTELVNLLAVDRLPALTVMSRVIVLHALQILKLRANPRAEYWVRNILLNTYGDELSAVKTLTDAKGDYFCMNKLIYDDIRSDTIRQDILSHIRKEGALQISHMQLGTKRAQRRQHMAWRKVLSDVDDTLFCSAGHYPSGIDRRFPKKAVYPGVLAFYRELDLGTRGPDEWPEHRVGNLVFLSARPHVYKDMSEKANFRKFEKLRMKGEDGRKGMHTVPSLLPGDLSSGSRYIATNDFEPLALKKFDNFKSYVSIYPEYQHVFVCDNGQGDVKAGEMMFDSFPYELEALYVHIVQDVPKTYGYAPEVWREKEFSPYFFRTYPEAALHAATRNPPLIRIGGLRRVCHDAVKDFYSISEKQWQSQKQKADRRAELNQALWTANKFLREVEIEPVELIYAEQLWKDGEKVKTPYGCGTIKGFDSESDLYDVELDWRPLDVQVNEHLLQVKEEAIRPRAANQLEKRAPAPLETVVEDDELTDDDLDDFAPVKKFSTPRRAHRKELRQAISETKSNNASSEVQQEIINFDGNSKPSASGAVGNQVPNAASAMESKLQTSTMSDSSSVSSLSSDGSLQEQKQKSLRYSNSLKVSAKIRGRLISKYVPPHLPKIDKKSSAIFSFFSPKAQNLPRQTALLEGEKCSTPYGLGTIVEHRASQKIVVVDMLGWKARAYLKEDAVKVMKESILASLFRRQSNESSQKPVDFPHARGTIIQTPFGEAEIIRPLPPPPKKELARSEDETKIPTMALDIKSWTLADGSHPKLYCTVTTAQMWKEKRMDDSKTSSDRIFSAFGTLVSSTLNIAGRFGGQKVKEEEQSAPRFERYYQDSAKVSTAFGNGVVLDFREQDGFYRISLTSWTLANGKHPDAWLRDIDISYQIAKGCQEGYPVLTKLGLTGTLESVQPTTGMFRYAYYAQSVSPIPS